MSYMGKVRPTVALTSSDIEDNAVTTSKLIDDAVTTAKIDDLTIVNADISASAGIALSKLASDPTYDDSGLQDDIALLGFKVASNGSLAKYNLVDQAIDAFEDASGIDASASTNEIRDSSGKYYSGGSVVTSSGGAQTTVGDYTVHTFLTTSTYTVDVAVNHDILIVAGGGGGSGNDGGGGGAGGVRQLTAQSITAATHAITVGGGGAGVTGTLGGKGGTSSVVTGSGTLSATGGGGGGGESNNGATGGSGGGGGGVSGNSGGAGNEGSYSPVEGYAGGAGTSSGGNYGGGSGGGAGAVGGAGGSSSTAPGGDGVQNDYRTGSNIYYGGGGGGHGRNAAGTGGQGGGGNGAVGNVAGNPGTVNTGGGGGGTGEGGGGGPSSSPAGSGGTGIVVLRYGASPPIDMTLVSNATTAVDGAPTTGDLVITYTDGAGTATVNTDIKAYISRDGSAYTSAVTLVSQGTTGGHTILTANGVDLSGVASGTSMRYKITTHNQSVAKDTRIQAVSLGWS